MNNEVKNQAPKIKISWIDMINIFSMWHLSSPLTKWIFSLNAVSPSEDTLYWTSWLVFGFGYGAISSVYRFFKIS